MQFMYVISNFFKRQRTYIADVSFIQDQQGNHRSGSEIRASNTCPATKPGLSANTAPQARRNTTSPICLPRPTCDLGCYHQGTMDLRASPSAAEGELGLEDFEGRSWRGLHRQALMTMLAFAFLQHRRLKKARWGKKN